MRIRIRNTASIIRQFDDRVEPGLPVGGGGRRGAAHELRREAPAQPRHQQAPRRQDRQGRQHHSGGRLSSVLYR